jgi:hypothetical protein
MFWGILNDLNKLLWIIDHILSFFVLWLDNRYLLSDVKHNEIIGEAKTYCYLPY